jgi:hypothetical protein
MTLDERIIAADAAIRQMLMTLKALNVRAYLVSSQGSVVWLTAPDRKFSLVTEKATATDGLGEHSSLGVR